jgi:hypothetical protein
LVCCLALPVSAQSLDGSIFAIEQHNRITDEILTYRYDIFCLERPGFRVKIPWDAVTVYGDPVAGHVEVTLYDMGMVECPHGWDTHLMGNTRQGSGGSEWVATYGDGYLVRFTAMTASVIHDDKGIPAVHAVVHPSYCTEQDPLPCQIVMPLSFMGAYNDRGR